MVISGAHESCCESSAPRKDMVSQNERSENGPPSRPCGRRQSLGIGFFSKMAAVVSAGSNWLGHPFHPVEGSEAGRPTNPDYGG